MNGAIWIGFGAAGAVAYVAWARGYPRRRRWSILSTGLVIAAVIYVGFAAFGGGGGRWLGIEVAGVALYTLLAWAGRRFSPWFISLGWALHVAWDVLLHGGGTAGTLFVPAWYPPACIGFDWVVAITAAAWAYAEGRDRVRPF